MGSVIQNNDEKYIEAIVTNIRGVDITLTVEYITSIFQLTYSGRCVQDYLEAMDMTE